ncbi:hypothetical protein [Thalassotalea euphylliae]|uniref:Uncharacterized protein n=1 Tax=Thalassotalea euphylliae TaxID=1655234 RepID=A0A3E0UGZ7_9GAMM|nr:hypothetical protein [Thalassotalea euphylliae]REL35884.1 hypothetical protein DXX92_11365 [Thalassotalea euphylliae]
MKNWTVIAEPVRDEHSGICSYLNYLTAKNHKNHRGITRIIPIHNSVERYINNCISEVTQRNLKRAKSKKGGRNITSYAQSFVFTLPPDIKLSDLQWYQVSKHIFSDLSDYLLVDKEQLLKSSFINLHDQKNQHINLVVNKVINGEVKREIQRKGALKLLKKSFNAAVLKYSNINCLNYVPETQRTKRYSPFYFNENKAEINAKNSADIEIVSGGAENNLPNQTIKKRARRLQC